MSPALYRSLGPLFPSPDRNKLLTFREREKWLEEPISQAVRKAMRISVGLEAVVISLALLMDGIGGTGKILGSGAELIMSNCLAVSGDCGNDFATIAQLRNNALI